MRNPSEVEAVDPPLSKSARTEAPWQRCLGRIARSHGAALAAATAGVVWFALQVGLAAIDPTNVGWLMQNDWAANHLGWLFFRSAPLSLPFGENPSYPYPIGSTLGFTDSIPLVAITLRPIASFLPQDFQYVGAWLLAAFALQGFVGAKLVKLATPDVTAQALGGALFALAPPLLHRLVGPSTGHASLCAHWIVLVALWLALAPVDPRRTRRRVLAALLLVVAAAGVHPYFVVMTAALTAALIVRLVAVERHGGVAFLAGGIAALSLASAGGLVIFGFVANGVRTGIDGFGYFSADLATLVNPMGWSRAFASLPVRGGQYEGFAYLGGGVLFLTASAIVLVFVPRASRPSASTVARGVPAAAVAVLLFVFALSDAISLAGERILEVGLYALVPALGATFRSSGRFAWPLHYLVILGAVALVASVLRSRPRALVAALAMALAAQAADVAPPVPVRLGVEPWRPPGSDTWALARGTYRHLAMYPPYLIAGGRPVAEEDGCGPPMWPWDSQVGLAHVAYRLGVTFNGAYAARLDPQRAAAHCRELYGAVGRGQLEPATIYVVHPRNLGSFRGAGANCGVVDGAPVCVSGDRSDAFARAIRLSPLR